MELVDLYTKGRKRGSKCSWAAIIIKDKITIKTFTSSVGGDVVKLGDLGGEIEAVIKGVEFCAQNNLKCNIFHEIPDIYNLCADIFGGKVAKATNVHTEFYHFFMNKNRYTINRMMPIRKAINSAPNRIPKQDLSLFHIIERNNRVNNLLTELELANNKIKELENKILLLDLPSKVS